MSFTGKVVLITGASSGIGADAAIHLSKLGASVAIVGRNASKLHAVAQQITAAGPAVAPFEIVADVTTDSERIIISTIDHFGQLDVLVNNAGITETGDLESFSIDAYDRIMNTNVRSVLLLTQLAIKHLEKTKGNVVNISSIAAEQAVPQATIYCMSKAALDHFTRCAALDLAKKGIRVNAVNPGIIETPIFQTVGITDDMMEGFKAHWSGIYPLGRIGQVSDTSKAIAFLASDDASFTTGQTLKVDGGYTLTSA